MKERTEHLALLDHPIIQEGYFYSLDCNFTVWIV